MFKFDFPLDETDIDTEISEHLAGMNVSIPSLLTTDKGGDTTQNVDVHHEPFEEIAVEDLLGRLPDVISYSSLVVPVLRPIPVNTVLSAGYGLGLGKSSTLLFDQPSTDSVVAEPVPLKLVRRDLFDAKFQLAVQADLGYSSGGGDGEKERGNDVTKEAAAFIEAPSDLVSGVYEGGLKTWECSLDLAGCLEGQSRVRNEACVADGVAGAGEGDDFCVDEHHEEGSWARINWADVSGKRVLELGCGTAIPSMYLLYRLFNTPPTPQSQQGERRKEIELHLQDYNASVLELVSLPNLLLGWYISEASKSYRLSTTATTINHDHSQEVDQDDENHLSLTPALKTAFLDSLKEYQVKIKFFAGSWVGFSREALIGTVGTERGSGYDLVLTSETIYRKESLSGLVDVMKAASSAARHHPGICLVAAKLVYFGVGGGMEEFVREVEKKGGIVYGVVWEGTGSNRGGVGRRLICVGW